MNEFKRLGVGAALHNDHHIWRRRFIIKLLVEVMKRWSILWTEKRDANLQKALCSDLAGVHIIDQCHPGSINLVRKFAIFIILVKVDGVEVGGERSYEILREKIDVPARYVDAAGLETFSCHIF